MLSSIEKTKPKLKKSIVNKHGLIDKGKGQTLLGKSLDNDANMLHLKRSIDRHTFKNKKSTKIEEGEIDESGDKISVQFPPKKVRDKKELGRNAGNIPPLVDEIQKREEELSKTLIGLHQMGSGQPPNRQQPNEDYHLVLDVYAHIVEIDKQMSRIEDTVIKNLVLNNLKNHFKSKITKPQSVTPNNNPNPISKPISNPISNPTSNPNSTPSSIHHSLSQNKKPAISSPHLARLNIQGQVHDPSIHSSGSSSSLPLASQTRSNVTESTATQPDVRRVRFEIGETRPQQLLTQVTRLIQENREEQLPQLDLNLFQMEKWEIFAIIRLLNEKEIGLPSSDKQDRYTDFLPTELFQKLDFYYKKIVFTGDLPKNEERYIANNEIIAKCLLSTWFGNKRFANYKLNGCQFMHYFNTNAKLEVKSDLMLIYIIDPGKSHLHLEPNSFQICSKGEIIQPVPTSFLSADLLFEK